MQSYSPEQIIHETKRLVESDKRSEIRLNANGGNSIIIACEPQSELVYIKALNALMPKETYSIIDLDRLLHSFISTNKEEIKNGFDLLKGSIHQIFKIPEGEEGIDFFKMILNVIKENFQNNKVPILIRTGALYGTAIDNIHIMENELIMKAALPLIILYPAKREGEQLLFLGKRVASKYRCMIVELN
jgi:hypothetical protein